MSMQSLILIQILTSMIMLERYKVIPGKSLCHLDDLQHIVFLQISSVGLSILC